MKTSTTLLGLAVAAIGCTRESGELRIDSVQSKLRPGQQQAVPSDELQIVRARIAVSEIELEGGKDDEREASMGDAVIEVVLGGEPTVIAVDAVEAGSYHTLGIELTVTKLDGGDASIIVEGTHRGNAFTFRSSINPEVEFRLQPEVEVPVQGSASAGVSFDVDAWFRDANGGVLDPSDGVNQGPIESSILKSMAVNAEIEEADGDKE